MNKKLIVIGSIVIVVIVAFVVLFFIQKNSGGITGGTGTTSTTSTATLPITVVTSTPVIATPTSSVITFGTAQGNVTTTNFYQNAALITQDQQSVVIKNEADYSITYNVPDSSFIISILSTPLEAARQEAEAAFLSSLGISVQNACKLSVYEAVPIGVSDEYPGESFPLSFCGGPATL
jgi:hypothetical protein